VLAMQPADVEILHSHGILGGADAPHATAELSLVQVPRYAGPWTIAHNSVLVPSPKGRRRGLPPRRVAGALFPLRGPPYYENRPQATVGALSFPVVPRGAWWFSGVPEFDSSGAHTPEAEPGSPHGD